MNKLKYIFLSSILLAALNAFPQTAYFADGYHGGIYGHYPLWQTGFMVDQLTQHKNWKINLEIEPETWDTVKAKDFQGYSRFKDLLVNPTDPSQIEFVNPSYAQPYCFNISGESIIRQFIYGMKKTRDHFPGTLFKTYSSEEPCFTSSLPQILKSLGFKYAVLKNPDTGWGGYTSAFGGELVNWVGPDGTEITTVPRYECEQLKAGSTWQTMAWTNSKEYINECLNKGIIHPAGMCYQDAGWKNGPWLGDGNQNYQPTEYITWADYIENKSIKLPVQNWNVSLEDILVNLMCGSQVLQRIARQVIVSENKILQAEKIASISKVYLNQDFPEKIFQNAWRTLMLSEHHDCWIVPYNGKPGNTWADKVKTWTDNTNKISDSIIQISIASLTTGPNCPNPMNIRIFNSNGSKGNDLAMVALPGDWQNKIIKITDCANKEIPSQIIQCPENNIKKIIFKADVPSVGYTTYKIQTSKPHKIKGAHILQLADGTFQMETDLYRIILDPGKGGMIKSLIAKTIDNKEFVDQKNEHGFNELRGNFYNDGGFCSSTQNEAKISIVENGPVRISIKIEGTIASNPFSQTVTLVQGQKLIDFKVKINWKGNPAIGEYAQDKNYKAENLRKAFYNDKYKLLLMFPLNLKSQAVFKNAPFDVCESKLSNTFFNTWDSIKNNIILNWVDIYDSNSRQGLALFCDHTTSYVHGSDFPLGLTIQYSGKGLWGRNYNMEGPTEINYALVPQSGKWDESEIWTENTKWNEPSISALMNLPDSSDMYKSLIDVDGSNIEITALKLDGNDLILRLFNSGSNSASQKISFDCVADSVEMIELSGKSIIKMSVNHDKSGRTMVDVPVPKFGFKTLKLTNVKASITSKQKFLKN